jgi:hypothetical protein
MHEETIIHLFWECSISRDFWNSIECFLNEKGFNVTLCYKLISLCTPDLNNKDSKLVSYIIILAKYFIFCNKYKKSIPNFNWFKLFLQKREKIEKIIAMKRDKLATHNAKWARLF